LPSGFIQLRRGLSEHVRDGRLSFFEASLYVFILMDAHPATGVCFGSAGLFSAVYGIPSRTCRDALEKLEIKGYLKRFPTRGRHGSYPILVNKYRCSIGAMKGMYVNCSKSVNYESIIYELCDESVDDGAAASVNDDVNEGVNDSAASKILETREKRLDKEPELTLLSTMSDGVRPEEYANVWNRLRGKLPKVTVLTLGRKKKVQTRIKAGLTLDRFREAVENCQIKPFLYGDNERGWTATFDWLITNDENVEKAINNSYGLNRKNGNGGNHAPVPLGKAEGNLAVLAESLGLTEHQSPAHKNGDLPGSEDRQANARIIDGDFTSFRPSSLPSGDGNFSGKPKAGGGDGAPVPW